MYAMSILSRKSLIVKRRINWVIGIKDYALRIEVYKHTYLIYLPIKTDVLPKIQTSSPKDYAAV